MNLLRTSSYRQKPHCMDNILDLQVKGYANLATYKLIFHMEKQQSSFLTAQKNHANSTTLRSLDLSLDKVTRLSGIESFRIVYKLVVHDRSVTHEYFLSKDQRKSKN